MADEQQVREAIKVWEAATGNTYKSGISADAVKSREKYKAWARSPAGRKAWEAHKAKKPEPEKKPEAEPAEPKMDGRPARAGAAALGETTATTRSAAPVGTAAGHRAQQRRRTEADVVRRTARERLQGTAAAKPEGGLGDVAKKEKKKREDDE